MLKLILSLPFLLISLNVAALPEVMLGTHTEQIVVPMLKDPTISYQDVKKILSKTGVPVLDQLWDERIDYRSQGCSNKKSPCKIVSKFSGIIQDKPLVLLPGFTGYRKMVLETAYDLMLEGYGPVYVLDFQGYGEAVQNTTELKKFIQDNGKKVKNSFAKRLQRENLEDEEVLKKLNALPVSLAHIDNISEYVEDINFVMKIVTKENPQKKVVINAHSTGALYLMLAISQPTHEAKWIPKLSRIILESPFLRSGSSDKTIPVPGSFVLTETILPILAKIKGTKNSVYADRSIPEFVTKATGSFDQNNTISHSPYRMSMTDNLRVWNGYETAGATWGWAKASVAAHFDILMPKAKFKTLNRRMKAIHQNLTDYKIGLVTVMANKDGIANPKGTKLFMRRLSSLGKADLSLCVSQNARHGFYVESDMYRNPFLQIIVDQLKKEVKANYGEAGASELITCSKM